MIHRRFCTRCHVILPFRTHCHFILQRQVDHPEYYADPKGLPVLALPLYASSRCHFMLQGTFAHVTLPIGLRIWKHTFAETLCFKAHKEVGSPACTSGKVMVYALGVADPRLTGNQRVGGAGAARLWFIPGKDMV
jgi:hypothetical protein